LLVVNPGAGAVEDSRDVVVAVCARFAHHHAALSNVFHSVAPGQTWTLLDKSGRVWTYLDSDGSSRNLRELSSANMRSPFPSHTSKDVGRSNPVRPTRTFGLSVGLGEAPLEV
jgi:hypothetical protein